MGSYTSYARKSGKRSRKGKKKFGKKMGSYLSKRKTGKKSIYG